MMIYKLFRPAEWEALQTEGQTKGAPIDITDGYVHFSTAEQVSETAAKYFTGVDGLMLLAVPTGPMEVDLKWEPSRGGALFPHLYRDLMMTDIAWSRSLDLADDGTPIIPPLT